MLDLPAVGQGFAMLFTWEIAWIIPLGVLIGVIVGAIPAFTIGMGMAIALPITFFMDSLSAIVLLSAMFTGSCFGSSISAILINTPGMPASVATTFDGYPMTRQGKHNEALGMALGASTLGALYGFVVLLFAIDPLTALVLKFGPPEMFLVAVLGLTLIAALSGEDFARGLMAGFFGILLGTVGMNPLGLERGTFGSMYLIDGIPKVPAMIGLFAASELFFLMDRHFVVEQAEQRRMNWRKMVGGVWYALARPLFVLRAGLIGVVIGAIPGIGAAVANLVSYNDARQRSKDKASYGQGNPLGVVAAESANSSSEGGSTATMLGLGIPGGGATAIMMGAFMLKGLIPGPRLFLEHKPLVYAFITSNFLQLVALLVVGFFFTYYASSVVLVPTRILIPSIFGLSVVGTFALRNTFFDTAAMLVFAILGYFLRRHRYPVAAMVVGLLLGSMADNEFLRTYQLRRGDFTIFFTRPISLIMVLLLVGTFVFPLWRTLRERRQATAARQVAASDQSEGAAR